MKGHLSLMTPTLDRFFRQWSLYKNALIVFLTINVFSVALSFFLAFYYFGSKRDVGHQQTQTLQQLQLADQTLTHLQGLRKKVAGKKTFQLRTRADEISALETLSLWNDLKNNLVVLGLQMSGNDFIGFISTAETETELSRLEKELSAKKQSNIETMLLQMKSFDNLTRVLLWTGLATLLFGLILPQYVLYKMGKTLNAIRLEMQHSALQFIKVWAETRAGFGDGAFKNVDFWMQILLLSTQHMSRLSSHPALQVTSELAYLVREELKKSAENKAA
jgi:hypothetical protein